MDYSALEAIACENAERLVFEEGVTSSEVEGLIEILVSNFLVSFWDDPAMPPRVFGVLLAVLSFEKVRSRENRLSFPH